MFNPGYGPSIFLYIFKKLVVEEESPVRQPSTTGLSISLILTRTCEFLKNTDGNCRRNFLMNYFKEKPDTPDSNMTAVMFVRQPANAVFAAQLKQLTQL